MILMMVIHGEMKEKISEITNNNKHILKIYYKKVIVIIYMLSTFTRNNTTLVSIFIFFIFFTLIQLIKPSFIYNNNGSLREFGVGYKNKTILPLWLFSIVLGIFTYILVLYYLTYFRIF